MAALIAGPAAIVLAGLALARLRRCLVVIDVDGPSMEPTLHHGDRVLVRRVPLRKVRMGDVVVVEAPGQLGEGDGPRVARAEDALSSRDWLIKRAVALPGDPVPASVARAARVDPGSPVPAGNLVLFGDNVKQSHDSRGHGYYRADQLLGVMIRPLRWRP